MGDLFSGGTVPQRQLIDPGVPRIDHRRTGGAGVNHHTDRVDHRTGAEIDAVPRQVAAAAVDRDRISGVLGQGHFVEAVVEAHSIDAPAAVLDEMRGAAL